MVDLRGPLLTQNATQVKYSETIGENAPCEFVVERVSDNKVLANISFQNGPVKEAGINGVMNEDLIAMVVCRLEAFQKTKFNCKENEMAINKLEEALMWLRKRTTAREIAGINGTHEVK